MLASIILTMAIVNMKAMVIALESRDSLESNIYIDVHSSAANWSLGQIFITSIHISLIIFLFCIIGFQKRISSICL